MIDWTLVLVLVGGSALVICWCVLWYRVDKLWEERRKW